MRKHITDIITPDEAKHLAGFRGRIPFETGAVSKVVSEMEKLGASITLKSYATVEQKQDGHGWHYDTGDSNQMPWCRWTASVGLTTADEFTGGQFEYSNPNEEFTSHHCDALIHGHTELHRVLPHEGNRRVLLIFLGADNGE
tara:strand:- start:829 stop:1254 length:426 start_codon:yes stop_codon:yes gene_type:complete